jgi:hypothetical protein
MQRYYLKIIEDISKKEIGGNLVLDSPSKIEKLPKYHFLSLKSPTLKLGNGMTKVLISVYHKIKPRSSY